MSFELLAVRVYLSLFIPDCLSEREQGERRGKWKYAKARRRAAAERGAPEVGVETAEKRESTMLKVLCGVMQFWFDIDGQRATPAVFIPGFGSIFPKSRRRVTECCPPSKLSKFTHFYGL